MQFQIMMREIKLKGKLLKVFLCVLITNLIIFISHLNFMLMKLRKVHKTLCCAHHMANYYHITGQTKDIAFMNIFSVIIRLSSLKIITKLGQQQKKEERKKDAQTISSKKTFPI